MTRNPLLLTLATAAVLAGCKPTTYDPNKENNDAANAAAANGPVALPPSVVSTKPYRCADNKVVYVDWLSDNKSANLRTEKEGSPTQVTSADPTQPMTAPGGYSLEGKASDSSVKIAVPGDPAQSCKG